MEKKILEDKEEVENDEKNNDVVDEKNNVETEKDNNSILESIVDENSEKNIKDAKKEIEDVEHVLANNMMEKNENTDIQENEESEDDTKFNQMDKREAEKYEYAQKCDKRRKLRKRIIISILLLLIFTILFSTIFAVLNINRMTIADGVIIENIDVSGLTKEDAKSKLEPLYEAKLQEELMLEYGEYLTNINPIALEVKYNLDEVIEEAYQIGKSENIFINNYEILFGYFIDKEINVEVSYNTEIMNNTIEEIGSNLPGLVVEASYIIESNELKITEGTAGIKIDNNKIIKNIDAILEDVYNTENYIQIPVIQTEPQVIDINKIHGEVYKEVKDASYTENPVQIFPEIVGIDFDIITAQNIIETTENPYIIPLIITEPAITVKQLGAEAFPTEISVFTTRYDPSDINRTVNVDLASDAINGIVLMPGETFSYNDALGPRTTARGYRSAKIYSAGSVIDGLGGGICQISSTLYNAALMADMEIVERVNHQFVTSYVGAGRDATVVYGVIDFRFTNTRDFPVMIISTTNNGVATVSIKGFTEEKYTYSFTTNTISTLPYSTVYENDDTLSAGTEIVKQSGAQGYIVETYITKSLNGTVISTELLSKDTYTPMTRIITRGTAPIVEAPIDNQTDTEINEVNSDNTISTEDV